MGDHIGDVTKMVCDTISRQWLMECVNERWIKFDTQEDENRFVHLIRDIAPSSQPTMYGYDIKTLAFVAGVMAQEGVTPEEAVATFRDIQKCVDYIWSDVHKTIRKSMDDVMNHDCSTCLHSDRMPHIYPCDKCSTGHERWERKA